MLSGKPTKKNKTKIFLLTFLSVLTFLAIWYYYEKSLWQKLPTDYSITRIKKRGKRVYAVIPDEIMLPGIIDMSVFCGISTGWRFRKAIEKYGDPDNIINE